MQSSLVLKGTVTKQLFDKDGNPKSIFQANNLWKLVKKITGFDLKIPFLLGKYTNKLVSTNLITIIGKQVAMQQLGGTTVVPVTAIALGIGTTPAAPTDTVLGSEITTNGGARGAATVTNTTTTTSGDTEQWQKTFNFTGSFAITEEGLFDNNSSGGNLLAHEVFSAINVINGDSLQVTHTVQAS